MAKKKFYITTPIYYVNDVPHIGHAYTTIAADVLARYHRLLGDDTFLLTGVDENSQKNVEGAKKAGEENDIQGYLDEMSAKWQFAWDTLGISHNDFIRTTEERHKKAVLAFVERVHKKGDIYFGTYEGLYCVKCEEFKTERDAQDGKCPIHLVVLDRITEKNYFFKLTKYRDALLKHFEEHPDFVQPVSRRNEVLNYIKDYMSDVSITRSSMKWGIAMPELEEGMSKNVIYVWFDALINYLTAVGFPDGADFETWWPADVHLVGKDILKFHAALWPAMLMAADLPLPKHIFAHGYFTVNGQKMGKSMGNAIDPYAIVEKYGNDVLRYFMLREIPFGNDGDFSEEKLKERLNGDLAHGFGNLVARSLTMIEKYAGAKIPDVAGPALEISQATDTVWKRYRDSMEHLAFDEALRAVQEYAAVFNAYVDQKKPWELAKQGNDELPQVLYDLAEGLRNLALLLAPFMPDATRSMYTQLGFSGVLSYEHVTEPIKPGTVISKGENLFPVVE